MAYESPAEWRTRYNAHLRSAYWDELRRDVVARAEGRCEVCHQRQATQVHHHHYDTLGHESLLDVVAVCDRCHVREHKLRAKLKAKRLRAYRKRNPKWKPPKSTHPCKHCRKGAPCLKHAKF